MTTKSRIVDPVQGTSSLVRPRYSEGLLLNDDDLTLGVDYTRDLSRLLFRSFFGCGVICGLVVDPEDKCDKLYIHISEGVALDCRGDPIHVPSPQTITLDPKCGVDIPPTIWVTLCRHDRCCAPRTAVCSCDDDESPSVCTRIRDGFELRIVPAKPTCACGCAPRADPQKQRPVNTLQEPKGLAVYETTQIGGDIKTGAAGGAQTAHDCWCADPNDPCYERHYGGECSCECGEDCDCDCIILARISGDADQGWTVDHSVRRFIRPVLMRDPVEFAERQQKTVIQQRTVLEQARDAERATRDAADKSKRMARDASKAAASADKAKSDTQAVAAANEVARTAAGATTRAVIEAEKARAAEKANEQPPQQSGTKPDQGKTSS